MKEQLPAIDQDHFRKGLGHFCSGITVITADPGRGDLAGLTCQSFFSLSLEPPLVAFSASKMSTSYGHIRRAGAFCINILALDQEGVARDFSRRGTDKFAHVTWRSGRTGAPILDHVQAWIECKLEHEYEIGDHHLIVGHVVDLQFHDKQPLLFYRGQFTQFAN